MSKFECYEPSELMDLLDDGLIKKAKKYINKFFYKTFKGIYFNNTVEDRFEEVEEDELKRFYFTPDMTTDSKKNPFIPYNYIFSSEPPIYYIGEFENENPVLKIKKKGKIIKYINLAYNIYIQEIEEPIEESEEEEPIRTKKKQKKRNKKKKQRDNNRNVEKPDDESEDEESFRE